jgi:hypothetical protein
MSNIEHSQKVKFSYYVVSVGAVESAGAGWSFST